MARPIDTGRYAVRITEAQLSALECAGLFEVPDGPDEAALAAAIDGRRLVVTNETREALVSALIELCNGEDAIAEDASRGRDERRFARAATRSLTNLIEKI